MIINHAQKTRATRILTTLINWFHTQTSISFVNQLHYGRFKNRNDKRDKKEYRLFHEGQKLVGISGIYIGNKPRDQFRHRRFLVMDGRSYVDRGIF